MKTLRLLLTSTFLWVGGYASAQSAAVLPNLSEDVAVIIGNKSYLDEDIPQVTFAHNDAQAMRQFVKDMLHIRDENIIFLEDATQAKMESAFGRKGNYRGKAFQYVKPDISNLYVFYSGHGVPGKIDGKSYLLPVDADIETADINGYPVDVLYENLAQVEAKSVTVFLDACFSGNSQGGTLIKQASGAQVLPNQTPIPETGKMTVVTAASKDQLASWDVESKHGLFTEYLLRALYGEADTNKDGEVRLDEVSTYLKQDMRYKARRTFNRDQVPSVNGNGDQVLAAAVDGTYPERPQLTSEQNEQVTPSLESELEPMEQTLYALKNANVRQAPDAFSQRILTISQGDAVQVVGKVSDKPWYALQRDNKLLGYVYEPLLSPEKTEQVNREDSALDALKERLARLEEQTKIEPSLTLPEPPQQTIEPNNDRPIVRSSTEVQGPQPNWAFDEDPYQKIEDKLKDMGAILAKQSFALRSKNKSALTQLNYNWIRIEADRCAISASLSLYHDKDVRRDGANSAINVRDQQVRATFWRELETKRRKLVSLDENQNVIQEIILYRYGHFTFKNRQDRETFKHKAEELQALCPQPRQVENRYDGRNDVYQQPAQRAFPNRPPPPPPAVRRPPPPRR
jgi:uncharacterized protein YgiM (DUF1202 family)